MREHFAAGRWPACLLAAALAGCAAGARPAPEPAPAPAPMLAPAQPAANAADQRVAAAPAPASPVQGNPLPIAIGYAERVRALPPAELGQEIQRLGERGYSPLDAAQLALALGQTRSAANQARAQSLLLRLLADPTPEAQPLQPFARLLALQIADQRRADEQAERQAQQLREAQRRIEQLNDRLEAVRAIERSLPGPARRDPPR
jgi:hypothetical protein